MKAIGEKLLFLYKFLNAPRRMGSVTPSSGQLAKKMLEPVAWHRVGSIAELGAGTGAITKHLGAILRPKTKVILFEFDSELRERLTVDYPDYVCFDDACKLSFCLKGEGLDGVDCILSGLPFFNFSPRLREHLLHEVFRSLKPGGLFVAFQYSLQLRSRLHRQFEIERIHFVPFNVPPAFVYVCRKREEQKGRVNKDIGLEMW
ncbi:class I SAM-dependent methyltransferase [Paenibacillus sp. GCM10027627]|uniref:class I SAM-dependent methyltransferase n=1 Tax=unclassified Paenibacillus TaxID=185978 RepID=UPI00362B3DD6